MEITSKGKKYKILIDKEDFKSVSKYTWWIKENNYVYTNVTVESKRTSLYLHRLILNAPKGKEVDHINHNPLDNRKKNLRICNKSQNNINKKNMYSGVNKFRNKWRARIKKDNKEIHLGIFNSREEALKARKKSEIKLFGIYSKHYDHR